ncbi:hypothetical protein [Glaciibacter psychrotolerans]|uniref:EcsC family protein n=1 Tax=Glaciibacter psychrotolerans TaxID=670054 RepID=A0A7Z0J4L7_9MICO|nr:hypothetical protein [Leifsonia psychrotolerans]NYJ18470.1 hypothetical protein [Leifsonia psychrotolerans]
MATTPPTSVLPGEKIVLGDISESEDFRSKIFQAIVVQRPVVVEYLKSLRREKPDATAAEILKELEKRYVATVTITSTGVGASAAIPVVGIPLALGLGVADLLFFYESSALYVLAATELHGIEVSDAERARPLVFGMLLGQKSQSQVAKLVLHAAGAGGVDHARSIANGAVGVALPTGWGEVLTQQLPDSALAPIATVIAREALKNSAKFGAGTLGKAIPFGLGAVVGGVGSFTFGRDVVKAAHVAFPLAPTGFPESLVDFLKPEPELLEPSRAARAFHSAAENVSDFGEAVWGKTTDVVDVFRSVDIDGDGIPDEARAFTAAKHAGTAIKGAAAGTAGAVGSFFKRKGDESAANVDLGPSNEPASP